MALRTKSLNTKKIIISAIIMLTSWSLIGYLVYNNFIKEEEPSRIATLPAELEHRKESRTPAPEVSEEGKDKEELPQVPRKVRRPSPTFSLAEGFEKLPAIPAFDFESRFLNDPKFTNLTQHGELPVRPGIMGRENPFLPFFGLPTTTVF
jgi:hypothetical protein